jgi:ABC-type hemin transport system substrate-binding protein
MHYFLIKKISTVIAHALLVPVLVTTVIFITAFNTNQSASMKIVSVNGTMSEIICSLGLESSLIGVDVTSTYPASLDKVAKIGHNRSVSSEGIVALAPSLVVGLQNDLKPAIIEQLTSSNIKTKLFIQDLSVEGTKKIITEAGVYFNQSVKADALIAQLDKDIALVKKPAVKKKVFLLKVQGVEQTNAGKNKKIIAMDGQLLTGFGPRLGKAMIELASRLQ